MLTKLRLGAVVPLLVSILFCVFFQISKHNSMLSQVNPFADDPYDAIGSFGIQTAAVLAVLSLLRAFWPSATGTISGKQNNLSVRTQLLAILAVGITLTGDAIAMARHTSLWMHSRVGRVLFGLLAGMALLTVAAGMFVYRALAVTPLPGSENALRRATTVSILTILILAVYPESLRGTLVGELFTVLVGNALLFIPLTFLGMALVPDQGDVDFPDPVRFAWAKLRKHQWNFISLSGLLIGLFLALAELHEGNGWPHLTGHVVFVLAVFVAIETAGLLLGYAFLRKPLGLS